MKFLLLRFLDNVKLGSEYYERYIVKKIIVLGLLALSTVFSSASIAGECVLKIKREACPGKESSALKPYGGKEETEEKNTTGSAATCKAMAEKSAKIVRKGTLAKKTISYSFDGKDSATTSDSAECK